jgi:hypothetical protein
MVHKKNEYEVFSYDRTLGGLVKLTDPFQTNVPTAYLTLNDVELKKLKEHAKKEGQFLIIHETSQSKAKRVFGKKVKSK